VIGKKGWVMRFSATRDQRTQREKRGDKMTVAAAVTQYFT
jgi:hypothetical protein